MISLIPYQVTQLGEELSTVGNVFCDALATERKFTLLYSVKPGISKKSFGINVAHLAGFPKEVVDDAKKALEEEEAATFASCTEEDVKSMKRCLEAIREDPSKREEGEQLFKKLKLQRV